MANRVEAPLICLSANGDTVCRSKEAARRMLVTTANSVVEFQRPSADAPWEITRNDILSGKHVSALSLDTRTGLLYACIHFKDSLLESVEGGDT